MEPKGCVLRAGRKGVLSKVGEFCMVFAEHPNLSTIPWVRLLGSAPSSAAAVPHVGPGLAWVGLFVTKHRHARLKTFVANDAWV